MNIGEFAKEYHLAQSTIRYYIQKELLLPVSKNKRYYFDEHCRQDMELILKLKDWHFCLEEIALILAKIRIYQASGTLERAAILQLLEQHMKENRLEQEQLEKRLQEMRFFYQALKKGERLNELFPDQLVQQQPNGVAIQFVPYLYCPHCQKMLVVQTQQIINGSIYAGALHCACGYQAIIKDGIIQVQDVLANQDSIHYDHWSYQNLYPHEINSIHKVHDWMFHQLQTLSTDGKVILENFINNYFFLYHYQKELNPKALYVVADKSLDIVQYYKQKIEAQGTNLHILYIAGTDLCLPLRRQSVDVYLDSFKTSCFYDNHSEFLLMKMAGLFHEKSKIIGSFTHIPKIPKDKKCDETIFQELLRENHYAILRDWWDDLMYHSSLMMHQDGEPLQHYSYLAEKRQ